MNSYFHHLSPAEENGGFAANILITGKILLFLLPGRSPDAYEQMSGR
jgi:hypothetical protein